MKKDNLYWMNYSIEIADNTSRSNLHVGAVLISSQNEFICSAFTNEICDSTWCATILSKIRKNKINNAQSLYLTINTLTVDKKFDLNELLKEIRINEVFVGIPDPNLTEYIPNDPVTTLKCIYRYPDDLQRKILNQNHQYYANSKQSIKLSPYYSEKRISNIVIDKLKEKGFIISKSELDANKQIEELAAFLANKYNLDFQNIYNIIDTILSESFDEKYSSYNYLDDARSLNSEWKNNFISTYNNLFNSSMDNKKILDIGVGSGNEATELFSKCKNITFVDIAPNGLEKIKKKIPDSQVVISRAENLSTLSDNSYELYVSLRTYNSSFFDVRQALEEASRVLKHNAVIIISGLIFPGTEFVDIYRGFDMIKNLSNEFLKEGFCNVQVFPTNGEIYLSALKK